MEIKNAKIESTVLGYEDHGILTFNLALDYGGSGQRTGGYRLDGYDSINHKTIYTAKGLELIAKIIETAGVDKWEDLKGQHIRVKASFDRVYAIGNILGNEWLDFEEFFNNN